ncbi:MAG: bifunctional phosphoribosyl-AMP cyclohydrolase/phosphoribosyl-ATP diphosphatase HisIE [Candidatus Kapaibacterium sp.]|jgi:phosphoribosyl-ATP pyrophosphohydrolase/phosphoribosyl-AMP cyclohydrolase
MKPELKPNFMKSSDHLIPAIIQDASTKNVLMLGYMNEEAYEQTVAQKRVTFYSRSKRRLWTKGETSGSFLDVVSVKVDCDVDAILINANPHGPVCHTGSDTCFNEENTSDNFLDTLEQIIAFRKRTPKEGSYTTSLFNMGINKIAQKVGEEAVELIIEAKDTNNELFLGEAADLLFHFLILLQTKGNGLQDVLAVLKRRHENQQ